MGDAEYAEIAPKKNASNGNGMMSAVVLNVLFALRLIQGPTRVVWNPLNPLIPHVVPDPTPID